MDRFESLLVASMSTPLAKGPMAPFQEGNWGINLCSIGGSGVGKSERIYAIGKMLGLHVYPIFASTKIPEHIGGYPVMTPVGFSLECALPQIRAAINDERAILFLDEISSAPRAVQAALLSLMNERTIGEYKLPPGVRIVLAMNPPDIAANGRELEIPFANRVLHYAYTNPTLKQWDEYMNDEYEPDIPNLTNSEARVRANWGLHFGAVLRVTHDFLASSGGTYKLKKGEGEDDGKEHYRLYDQPEADDPRAAGPWPSHRTWSWAVNGVTTARCLGLGERTQLDVVAGLVGAGLAADWSVFMKKLNLPNPEDVLLKGWQIPKQLDVVRTVLSSCAIYVANEADPVRGAQLATSCWLLLFNAASFGYADVCTRPAKTLLRAHYDGNHPDPHLQEAVAQTTGLLYDKGHLKYIGVT